MYLQSNLKSNFIHLIYFHDKRHKRKKNNKHQKTFVNYGIIDSIKDLRQLLRSFVKGRVRTKVLAHFRFPKNKWFTYTHEGY